MIAGKTSGYATIHSFENDHAISTVWPCARLSCISILVSSWLSSLLYHFFSFFEILAAFLYTFINLVALTWMTSETPSAKRPRPSSEQGIAFASSDEAFLSYVTSKLRERPRLKTLTSLVHSVLVNAGCDLITFNDPNSKEDIVKSLETPWLYYINNNNQLPPHLAEWSAKAIRDMHNAATMLAAALMQENVAAPPFFHSEDGVEREQWKSYQRLQPAIDSEHEHFINAIRRADLERHDVHLSIDQRREIHVDQATNQAMNRQEKRNLQIFHIQLDPCLTDEVMGEDEGVSLKDEDEQGNRVAYMVRLPVSIPGEGDRLCCDTLFITRDDLALFAAIRSSRKAVILGNPGIGKSWFQYLCLLFSVRADVYKALTGALSLPPSYRGSSEAPQVIVRLMNGAAAACVYFLAEEIIVHRFESVDKSRAVCRLTNSDKSLMMFEPGETNTPVFYFGLDRMQILATVSPDSSRYKEFVKNGGLQFYKPCPSTPSLLAFGAVMRPRFSADLQKLYSTSNIKERIRSFGHFQRYIFPSSASDEKRIILRRDEALLNLSNEDLQRLALHYQLFDQDKINPLSHWFLRYEIDREKGDPFGAPFLMATSKSFMHAVNQRFTGVELSSKIEALMQLDRARNKGQELPLARGWLEDLFVAYTLS
jgi:hypothetical protein